MKIQKSTFLFDYQTNTILSKFYFLLKNKRSAPTKLINYKNQKNKTLFYPKSATFALQSFEMRTLCGFISLCIIGLSKECK